MAQVVTAITTQTITVTGGNLFQIASDYLGDATQWYRIAQLNGLSDPQIVGTVTLKIPPAGPGNGGILGL